MMMFKDYLEHLSQVEGIPFLGYLAWYNVQDSAEVTVDELNALIEKHDAPIPEINMPKMADVFRRGCNAYKYKIPLEDGGSISYRFRDAGHDGGFVFRSLVAEHLDAKEHSLGYREVQKAICTKENGTVVFSYDNTDIQDSDMNATEYAEQHLYNWMMSKGLILPTMQLRSVIRVALERTMFGTKARPSGGIYFIQPAQKDSLQALINVFDELDYCSVHPLPLIDDEQQREMVAAAFESESVGATQDLILQLDELLSSSKIPVKKFDAITEAFVQQREKLSQYQTLLNMKLSNSDVLIQIAEAKMKQIMEVD